MSAENEVKLTATEQALEKLVNDWASNTALYTTPSYKAGAYGMLFALWSGGLISYDVYRYIQHGLDEMPKAD